MISILLAKSCLLVIINMSHCCLSLKNFRCCISDLHHHFIFFSYVISHMTIVWFEGSRHSQSNLSLTLSKIKDKKLLSIFKVLIVTNYTT